jgi:glycosyltransferase involved in cell wall biosynthesis
MKLLLIGALPPPPGGDAIWAQKYLNHTLTKSINIKIVNTSLVGKRAYTLGKKIQILDEIIRTYGILRSTLVDIFFFKPNIIHINSNCAPLGIIRDFLIILIANMKGIPLILHCHANVPDSIGNSRISISFLRRCLKCASKVLVLNAQSEKFCNNLGKVVCSIMPNFIDEDEISDIKIIYNKISNIVFVGHIIKTKGIVEVIEIAKQFPKISFTMAGMVTTDIANIMIPSNIAMIGNVEKSKLKEILKRADIFLFPTHTEGFSLALLEAMASGLPIISTTVGANEDMLENKGGILTPVGDVQEMCSALNKLQCPILRKQMSAWNISKVRNIYTSTTVIGRLKCLYNAHQKK